MPDWGLICCSDDRPLTYSEMPVDISVNRNIIILYCAVCIEAVCAFSREANDQSFKVKYI